MNMNIFSKALEDIDSRYLEEVLMFQPKHQGHSIRKWTTLAACLCMVIALAAVLPRLLKNDPAPSDPEVSEDGGGAPQVIINDTCYIVSPYLAVSKECPSGFTLGGTITSGELESCEYYVNPDIPEWVYVHQQVTIGDTLDETGSIPTVAPYMAYLRYVDASIRGMHFVCYQDQLYVSMWSASSRYVDAEVYDLIREQYDLRIEGETVEGFSLVGTAEFTGLDTIPKGDLSSNTENAQVYANPAVPDVLLVSTSWYTATKEEQGETLHTGFNVYVRCDLR